jgi:hypothetical protein
MLNENIMFLCKKNTTDDHNEMNVCYYEKHSVGELLPKLLLETVNMDNESYPSWIKKMVPIKSWTEENMWKQLTIHHIPLEDDD